MKNEGEARDSGVLSNPLSFLRSGRFNWDSTHLDNRNDYGFYWTLRSSDTVTANDLDLRDNFLFAQFGIQLGNGLAVRCVVSGGLAPDSICPKGWQLPTYSGDKSFYNLINTSYSMKDSENERDAGVISTPLSFHRTSCYDCGNASLDNRNGGYYQSLRSVNTIYANVFGFYNTTINPQSYDIRGYGFAVRSRQLFNPSPPSLIPAIL